MRQATRKRTLSTQLSSGDLPSGVTNVVLDDSTVLDLSNATTSMSTTDVSVGDQTVTLTQAVTLNSGTPGTPVVLTNSSLPDVTVDIPDGTEIKGPVGWDGTVAPPTTGDSSGTAPSGFTVGNTVDVGSKSVVLSLGSAVKIVLAGVTGTVGYKPTGSSNWVTITTKCNSATDYSNISAPGECYFPDGSNTIVWTYHFTTFGGLTPIPAPVSSGGSGSGGGGSISFVGGGSGTPNPLPGAIAVNTEAVTTTTTNQGQVLGAAVYNFAKDLTIGSRGVDVTALQQFLIDNGFSIPAGATGYFGAQTKAAAVAFQKARGISQTGYVGSLTRAELNKGVVATTETSKLNTSQASAVIGFLQAFGADASIIANVKAALGI